MTCKIDNVYINSSSIVGGPLEKECSLAKYFDKLYDDYYASGNSFEKGQEIMQKESINYALKKGKYSKEDIDLVLAGDLSNQINVSMLATNYLNKPLVGLYSACSTNNLGIILASLLISFNSKLRCLITTSSNNKGQEREFRSPPHYGMPKPLTSTFTATGGASCIVSSSKSSIKVSAITIGKSVSKGYNDPLNLGACMAPSASLSIYEHLTNMKKSVNDYDLILTGDLGKYGSPVLIDMLKKDYNINIASKHKDCGVILYGDFPMCNAGASGPTSSSFVLYGKIFNDLINHKLKRVLVVATGALFSPQSVLQKDDILGISHVIELESV